MAYFAKFTERGQRALLTAQREAAQLGRTYVGTEHLLLGVLSDPGAASVVLKGITLDAARQEIIQILGRGDDDSPVRTMVYTPRTKKVLEQSVREARELKQNYVGTEHILLALMREREGVAAHVMIKMGMDLGKAREELLRALSGGEENASNASVQEQETPALDQFSRDLTRAARAGELDPVIGRAEEIERIVQILSRRTKNNPVLIGEPGVGKSAVAEGLAQKIAEGNVPELLRGKRIVSLDLAGMLAGAKYRGEFEERMKNVMEELKRDRNIILFIDELHTIVGAGAAEGAIDAANILKPPWRAARCSASARRRWTNTASTSKRTPRSSAASSPSPWANPAAEEAVEILRACATGTRRTTGPHHGRGHHRGGPALRPLYLGPLFAGQGHRPYRRGRLARAHQGVHRAAGHEGAGDAP